MRSGAATGALFLCLGAALGGGLTHPGAVWEKLTTGEDAWPVGLAFLWMTAALGGLSFGVWRTGAWLIELWSLWGQVGALARGRPARMQLRVHASGREERSRFRLDLSNADALFSAALCGALCPDWLAGLAEQEVWVYGRRSGPWLLLLDDGRLGLVHPGE